MTTLSVDKLNLDSVRKALNFVIGQDSTPDVVTYAMKSNRGKDSIYYEDDYNLTYEYDQDFEDAVDETYNVDNDDAAYWEDDEWDGEADEAFMAEENAAEYDEVFAAYVEARQRMNQMRLARG